MRHAIPSLLALILAAPAAADVIFLEGGGRLRGRVVEETPEHVVVEVGPGRITLPASRVERIDRGRSALDAYAERRAALAGNDFEGWLSLALWARDQGLATQAREAFERVLAMQPGNPIANAALGRVRMADRWMSEEEAYRARGYVRYRGRWMDRTEYDAMMVERRVESEARAARAEADARVREAEARAQEAEARAAAAEAARPAGPYSPGPYGLVVGTALPPSYCCDPVASAAPPEPPPPPPPRSPERRNSRTSSLR